jgi:hypothetical protein
VNSSDDDVALVPPSGVDTVTSTNPADPAGAVAVQLVVLQVTDVAGVEPKSTVVTPGANPDPLMVTTVPAVNGPAFGLIPVTPGGKVKPCDVSADSAPLLDTVCPVNTRDVDVPPVSVTVKVTVNGPTEA